MPPAIHAARPLVICCVCLALLGACGKSPPGPGASAAQAVAVAPPPGLLLAEEDLFTVGAAGATGGPTITGSLQPERRADLRAELPAVVLKVLKDNGEPVRAGEVLVQLDDTALRDNVASAQEAVRAAELTLQQADRMVARQRTLREQGMTSSAALEDTELRRNAAASELAAARAREVAARQQLQRTVVRAPFDGVVSERRASPGDTAQVGKELMKVIDPRTMRFEGLVSADRLGEVKVGQAVSFKVNGYANQGFTGRVKRLDAAANAATRQVEVIVAFEPAASAPRVAGLFAEGRIAGAAQAAPMLPESALVRGSGGVSAWRLAGGRVQRVALRVGERDARSGEVPLLGGLNQGDRILRRPGSSLVDGQAAELARPEAAPPAASGPGR